MKINSAHSALHGTAECSFSKVRMFQMNFKPMLSASLDGVDLSTLRYPLLASPKLDGVRCIVWEGVAYSRNAKPIRNKHIQEWAKEFHNLDGELIVGSPTDPHCLNNTQSGVMSYKGEPDFRYFLFDSIEAPGYRSIFMDRVDHVQEELRGEERIECVGHIMVHSADEVQAAELRWIAAGYEGVMLRDPQGPYKHGRATLKEGYLMKLKRFMDGEAVVTGLEEGHINENTLQRDELGRAKRTTHQENLTPSGMVGTIIAVDPNWGELRIAPGTMPHAERAHHWQAYVASRVSESGFVKRFGVLPPTDTLVGKTIHWRSFGYGVKDKPRFPRYYGIREDV
jgi:DNA ligase-1